MTPGEKDDQALSPRQSLVGLALEALRHRAAIAGTQRPGLRAYVPALFVLAAVPPVSATTAQILAVIQDHHNAILQKQAAPHFTLLLRGQQIAAAKAQIGPLMRAPTITDLAERFAATLPEGAYVHAMETDRNGAIRVEVDCMDPEILRAALGQDSLLGELHMVGQEPAESGVRVVLTMRRQRR